MPRARSLCFLVTCLLLLVVGISLLATNTTIFSEIIRTQVVLSPTAASLPLWRDTPALKTSMYIFNVTNVAEVYNGGKPDLVEVGPFVFDEEHEKTKIKWNRNGTVTYHQVRTWHHRPDLSAVSLDTEVTVVNSVAATVGSQVATKVPKGALWLVNAFLAGIGEKLFVTKTVREIIFDGYEDPILDDVAELAKWGIKIDGATARFGFFYGRNGSEWQDGVFNMFTGSTNISRMGQVFTWNYSSSNFFPGSCGSVRGSAGEMYPPGLEKTQITMFSNDVCRRLTFDFNAESWPKGIHSYEFTGTEAVFDNGTGPGARAPENRCYNPPGARLNSGAFNASVCRFGAPVFISFPHFYLADPAYRAGIGAGLAPDAGKHGTYMRVEPLSGLPVDVVARFQVNVLLDEVPGISMFAGLRRTFTPVMWFETRGGIPDSFISQMKLLSLLPDIVSASGWTMVSVAVTMIVVGGMCRLFREIRTDDLSPILNQSLVEEQQSETESTNTDIVSLSPAD